MKNSGNFKIPCGRVTINCEFSLPGLMCYYYYYFFPRDRHTK